MDSLDLEILSLIQNDARVAHASVGERLGLTAPAVHARIKRLEREGVIRGYLTSIDPLAVNQSLLAFVRVMNNAAEKDEQTFECFIRQQPNILECHDVSGEDSPHVKGPKRFTGSPPTSPGQSSRVGRSRADYNLYFSFHDQGSWRTIADNAPNEDVTPFE
jgi:DNA-binding Lrp family transcriptional regulator